jgi:hypothetical protein
MAVVFKRLFEQAGEYRPTGVVIDRECYGETADPTHPVQGLNLEFEGWEDALADEFSSKRFYAVHIDDEEVDIEDFEQQTES